MRSVFLTLLMCSSMAGADPPADLGETGGKILSKASPYFEILSRAPLTAELAGAVKAATGRIGGFRFSSKPPGAQVRLGKKWFAAEAPISWIHYEDAERRAWIDVIEFVGTDNVRAMLEKATQWHYGRRTGDFFAFVTYQREPGEDVVAAGLRRDRYLLNFGMALPFPVPYDGEKAAPTREQVETISSTADDLARVIEHTARAVISPTYTTWFPPAAPSQEDLRMMRLAGFSRFWSEVKYNFVFLRQRPNLDWDAVLDKYLPRVAAAQDDDEYVRILQEAVALLEDGHTRVFGNKPLGDAPVVVEPVEGKPIVVFAAASTGIQPGMELLEAEGLPIREKLARDVYPYIASSTAHDRERTALREVFRGPPGSSVRATFADPAGRRVEASLARGSGQLPQRPGADFRELAGGIAYLAVNTFATTEGVKVFDANLPSILKAKALIIDVRENPGGNSGYSHMLISRLIARRIEANKVAKWRTRAYRPAFRAWGKPEEWYQGDHGFIDPYEGKPFLGPVAVLIGAKTGSASEDFIVALAAANRATLIGSPSAGSTGQPLTFTIYGATVGICTKWNTFPDGTEFVGVGVKPGLAVERTRRDVIEGKDPVLEAAIRFLSER